MFSVPVVDADFSDFHGETHTNHHKGQTSTLSNVSMGKGSGVKEDPLAHWVSLRSQGQPVGSSSGDHSQKMVVLLLLPVSEASGGATVSLQIKKPPG